jgi:hypothetical protein
MSRRYIMIVNTVSVILKYIKLTATSLVWYPGQNGRIAPVPFFYGCRKRRLKD